jgi:hypothetical protein
MLGIGRGISLRKLLAVAIENRQKKNNYSKAPNVTV